MSDRVCPGDGKANTSSDADIAFAPEEMEKAIYFGIVPDELVDAGRPQITHDELHHYNGDDLHELSPGITAWRAIAFALERDLPLPRWCLEYLTIAAKGVEEWAMLNEHPAELKDVFGLHGKRKHVNEQSDPRWIYDAICQLRDNDPKASVKSLVQECMKQFPHVGTEAENVRQKYYQGKKLAETGQDYKGRGRKQGIQTAPDVVTDGEEEIEF